MNCHSCLSNSGEKRISPASTIYEGTYWLLEHAYPTSHLGWVVLVTKRHVEALHELSHEEFIELGLLMEKTIKSLYTLLDCEKEYSMCFAEIEGFKHIHFHTVPKPINLPETQKGTKVFERLKVTPEDTLKKEDIIRFCTSLAEEMNKVI